MPGAAVTGSELVLGDDVAEEPAKAAAPVSEVRAAVEPPSGAEAVLGDEPLDRGSRPSARVESPIRTDADDDAIDLGGPAPKGAKKPAARHDLDATEEVLAGEPAGRGSSAINWNEIGADSGVAAKPADDVTVPYDFSGEGSSDDSLLHPEDLAKHADESAVNLGDMPPKSKSPSGIDVVAEALESGVNLEDEPPISPAPGTPSVEFDDILTDSSESLPPVKKAPAKTGADEVVETLEPTDDDLEAVGKGKKKKKKSDDVEDEAAALFAAEDASEAMAVPAEEEAEAVAVPTEDDEAVAAPVADEDTDEVGASKKGKDQAKDDGEPSPKAGGKAKPQTVPVGGPSCLGRLIGAGVFGVLGILVTLGGLAGLAFVYPDLIEAVPGSPWAVKRTTPPPKIAMPLSPAQKAYEAIATGDFDTAIAQVKDAPDEPAKAALGEARALKVLKDRDLAAKPLDEKEKAEIGAAVKDLRDGKNPTLANQIERAVRRARAARQARPIGQVARRSDEERHEAPGRQAGTGKNRHGRDRQHPEGAQGTHRKADRVGPGGQAAERRGHQGRGNQGSHAAR